MTRPRQLRVAVAGASGLVGRALLASLSTDPSVASVQALWRRAPTPGALPKGVTPLLVDPARLGQPGVPGLPPIDAAFCALGTTIRVAGSQAAFRAVDHDAVLAFAAAARAAGATRFGLVSALGADAHSPVFYNRVKGEVEAALQAQGWPQLVIARPSLLLGDRSALGQPARIAERWGQRLLPGIGPLMPRRWRPVEAAAVARALHRALLAGGEPACRILDNATLLDA